MRPWILRYLASLSSLLLLALLVVWIRDWSALEFVGWNDVSSPGQPRLFGYYSVFVHRGLISINVSRSQSANDAAFADSMMGGLGQEHAFRGRDEGPDASLLQPGLGWLGFYYASDNITAALGVDRSLYLPLWAMTTLASIAPALWAFAAVRKRRLRRRGHCLQCGYDLRASTGRCPECGRLIAESSRPSLRRRCAPAAAACLSLVVLIVGSMALGRWIALRSQAHWAPYETTFRYVTAMQTGSIDFAAAEAALKAGADVRGCPFSRASETMEAALRSQDPAFVQLLIDHGFRLDADEASYNLLTWGLPENHDTHLLQQLLSCGANPNPPTPRGEGTLLTMAVDQENIDAARLLLHAGADVNAANGSHQTALHLISSRMSDPQKLLALLLEFHPRLDLRDNDGNTALHIAVQERTLACIRLLLHAGADPGTKNSMGQTALDLAIAAEWPQGVEVLKGYGK